MISPSARSPRGLESQIPPGSRTALPSQLFVRLLLLLLLFVVTIGAGCTGGVGGPTADVEPEEAEKVEEAAPVAAIPLQRGSIESVLRFSTNLEAETEVEVYSEASRQVTRLLVEEGDYVRKGQLLLELQRDEQVSALERVESQLKKAQRDYDRQKRLFDQELISEQAYSEATYDLEQLLIAKADAERDISYTSVKAPISGMLTQRMVSLGDHVQNNAHLFSIVDFNSIVARIFVPEKELSRLSIGQSARLMAQAQGEDTVQKGAIQRIAPVVDSRSGTVKVTLSVPRDAGLRPGMYVEVELVAETDPEALLLPKRALVYDEDQTYVFRVQGGTVERVLVRPLIEERDFVKIGPELSPGDNVVVAGQAGLKDGAKVRVLGLEEALETFSAEAAEAGITAAGIAR